MIENLDVILLNGMIASGIYALLALGFTLIYGVTRVLNLAHGSLYMLGAYMFYVFGSIGFLSLQPIPLILAVLFTGIVGSIMYRLSIHPILGDEVGVMVATVCLAIIFQQIIMIVFGPTNVHVPSFYGGYTELLGVSVINARILAFSISLALFGILLAFIHMSKLGKSMKAVSQDREAAMLMGINTDRLYMLTMALSAILAALAGIFHTASTTEVAAAWMWLYPLALSFAIVILGGLGSIKGSLIGAFIIGYAEQTVVILAPQGGAIVAVVPFAIMIIILVLRPKGLFGKRVEMED